MALAVEEALVSWRRWRRGQSAGASDALSVAAALTASIRSSTAPNADVVRHDSAPMMSQADEIDRLSKEIEENRVPTK